EYGGPGGWDDTHGWSKFAGGTGVAAAAMAWGMSGTPLGNTPISQLPGKAKDGIAQGWNGVKSWWHGKPAMPGGGCFTEGTQIVVGMEQTEDECGNLMTIYTTVNIEDVKVGDWVYSYNTLTGETELCKVTETFSLASNHINRLTFIDEHGYEQTIESTDAHPFWVVFNDPDLSRAARSVADENGMIFYHENLESGLNGYWVEAKDLRIRDVFLDATGKLSTLTNTVRVEQSDGVAVFNFTVENNHNYYILAKDFEYGQSCVLVHNNSQVPRLVQTKGHTLNPEAAKQIIKYNDLNPRKYNRGVLGKMLEAIKKSEQLPRDYHGKIGIDGSYYSPEGVYIGNFLE
ncbi:MAG: HINT domain-containing protein, partial [Planctomycetaceae bacterium]|nr:HINT domain-containing protein [Planctomycetaceae bacterium]